MEKLRKLLTVTLFFTLFNSSIYAQPPCNQEDEGYSVSYMQCCHSAHWSAYIPIGATIVAAIFFGIADKNDNSTSSSSTYSRYDNNCSHQTCGCHYH